MQKYLITFSFLTFAFPCILHPLPIGNTAAPQLIEEGFFISRDSWIDVRIGYEGDFLSNGRMKQCIEGSGRVDNFEQWTNAGTVTLNILDRLDIFGVFGSSRIYADWRFTENSLETRAVLETFYQYVWACGARGILFEWDELALGLGGRYETANYTPSLLTINAIPQATTSAYCNWNVWQINFDISYKIDLFTPYIGCKFSHAETELGPFSTPIANNHSDTNHFKNKTPVGLFLGCSLSTGKYFMINIEGRLIDEEGVTISGDLRF
jgi:hypothetical protein